MYWNQRKKKKDQKTPKQQTTKQAQTEFQS